MEETTRVNTLKTIDRVTEFLAGLMVADTLALGKREKCTARVPIKMQVVLRLTVSGLRASAP